MHKEGEEEDEEASSKQEKEASTDAFTQTKQ